MSMKIQFTEEMIKRITVYTISLVLAVAAGFLFFNIGNFGEFISKITTICIPFILGVALAFVLRIPVMTLETNVFYNVKQKRLLSTIIVFIGFIVLLSLMVSLIIPSIIESLQSFLNNNNQYAQNLTNIIEYIEKHLKLELPSIETFISDNTENLSKQVLQIANYSIAFIKGLVNFLLALVSAFYLILDKEKLSLSLKKINYALFSDDIAHHLSIFSSNAREIFDKYIVGSLIDSSIIGIITFLGMSLLQIPYPSMIAFIIGVTNIIPVFGPFLGAIPVAFLLLLIKPLYCLFFLIFIIVLQQVDGNILKPIVLGDQLGLSGFWILFSVTLGGGLAGIIGMFIGVPIFALFYKTIHDYTELRLKEKHIDIQEL